MMVATRRNLWATGLALLFFAAPSSRAAGLCVGDCDSNNTVVVNELITGVGVSLGRLVVASCRNFDPDSTQTVNVNELIQGVRSALYGCPPIADEMTAVSTSRHYVDVHFPAAVGAEAINPANYSIQAPDSSSLTVFAARANLDPTVITLTTEAQEAVRYQLTYAPTADVAPFDGTTLAEGRLVRARALDNTRVLLTFDVDLYDDAAPPEGGAALDRTSYRIANPDLEVTAAAFPDGGSEARRSIILTTAGQSAVVYTVEAAGVVDAGGHYLDPDHLTAPFDGIAVDDDVPPRLTQVIATGAQTIVLTFSEPLAPAAADPRFFSISPSISVTGAQLTDHGLQIVLTTAPQIGGQTYAITVTSVRDQAGNLVDPNARQMTFPSGGTPPVEPDELPRVVGAVSTSNLTVVVHFSKSMSDSALNPSHYQVELEPDVGMLTLASRCIDGPHEGHLCASPGFMLQVCAGGPHPGRLCRSATDCETGTCETGCSGSVCEGARFLDANRTQVEIQTISQNDGIYTITAAGVTDTEGKPLAPRQVVGGAIVDPTSATFAGIGPFTNGMIPDNAGVDSDGDGMPDTDEQAGWDVTITLLNGDRATQHMTANPLFPDTDNDGLVDPLEFAIGSNPRSNDSDGEGLQDAEEYNLVYSDPTFQDTDRDGISDNLEVEFFKTDAIVDDSDGDGITDGDELFASNRDPRIADLPAPEFSVGEIRLQIYEHFSYTDENGQTRSENSSTETSLVTGRQFSQGTTADVGGGFEAMVGASPGGCDECAGAIVVVPVGSFTGIYNENVQSTRESNHAAEQAFQTSLDKALEISTNSAVTREITGARMDVTVTLENKGDVAFTLSNIELTALTADPLDPSRLVPVATLLPDGQQQSGDAATFTVGPGQSRGPIVFSNREVFPNLVEDLMKAPRGVLFKVANYDLTTGDDRNFAYGLQTVRERTTSLTIDFGADEVKQKNAITAAVLNRPRAEMRCAPGGDHPDQACASDADCGTSQPCAGGRVIGGLSSYTGTGVSAGIPLDFVLRDILQMRRTTPPVILAGAGGWAVTVADPESDDIQVVPNGTAGLAPDTVVVAPGRNGILDTVPGAELAAYPAIFAGPDGVVDTTAMGDDQQLVPVGTANVASGTAVIGVGSNARLDTAPLGDDVADPGRYLRNLPSQGAAIVAGPDGVADTVADPADIQVIPPGTRNLPSDAIVVAADGRSVITSLGTPLGGDGLLKTAPSGDDVVAGPDGIVAGNDGSVQSVAQGDDVQSVPVGTRGVLQDTVVVAAGQNGILETPQLGDDVADVVTGYEVSRTCNFNTPAAIIAGPDLRANTTVAGVCTSAFLPHFVGEPGCKIDEDCGTHPTTNAPGVCSSDEQLVGFNMTVGDRNTAVVLPKLADGTATIRGTSVRSVPPASSDDVFVGPGIPCTTTADCTVVVAANDKNVTPGSYAGECSGPQAVVRVEQRRNGQFKRYWRLLSNKTDLVQTDFAQILVQPGDAIYLSFVQDADRDGLVAEEEFMHGSSDVNRDSDSDLLDDFAEIRVGWLVGPVGQPLRRVFSDPNRRDSDADGLSDRQEQDLRTSRCACDATGPKLLLGNGNVLRGQPVDATHPELGAGPCSSDDECTATFGAGSTCRDAARCTTADYASGRDCPPCDSDPSLHRSDPRIRDTDGDRVTDADEVFGYRTGAGIVSAPTTGPAGAQYRTVVAGDDEIADSVACPENYCAEEVSRTCVGGEDAGAECASNADCPGGTCEQGLIGGTCLFGENNGAACARDSDCRFGICTVAPCQTDGDCPGSHQCFHERPCDDVQVVPPGTRGLTPTTVVIAPGIYRAVAPNSLLQIDAADEAIYSGFVPGFCADDPFNTFCSASARLCRDDNGQDVGPCILYDEAAGTPEASGESVLAFSSATGDDVEIVPFRQSVTEFKGTSSSPLQPRCVDGSEFYAGGISGLAERFIMCGIVKPGPNGSIDSEVRNDLNPFGEGFLDNLLVPEESGQKIEVTDALNPDTDGDEIEDGIERLVGASPNDPEDTGNPGDTDQDGLTDNLERGGWTVAVIGQSMPSKVGSNLYDPDTDGDGLPDYAEYHLPCRQDLTMPCRTNPTIADTDGDGLSDFDELSADQIVVLTGFNGFFRAYQFNGNASEKYGTDPLNPDSDVDGRSDFKELLEPVHVAVPGETGVRTVFTDPLQDDTDHDGWKDNFEVTRNAPTDPTAPDTDGDGRLDAREGAANADPLVKDKVVTVTYRGLTLQTTTTGQDVWFWKLYVQHPATGFPGEAVSVVPDSDMVGTECSVAEDAIPPNLATLSACRPGCAFHNPSIVAINEDSKFVLREGEGFLLSGDIARIATCLGSGSGLTYHLYDRFFESYGYETVTGFTSKTVRFAFGNTVANLVYEITTE